MIRTSTHRQRISLNNHQSRTGKSHPHEVVDAETGDPVDQEDRVKGYKIEGDRYLLLEGRRARQRRRSRARTPSTSRSSCRSRKSTAFNLDESFYLCRRTTWRKKPSPSSARRWPRKTCRLGRASLSTGASGCCWLQPRGKGLLAIALRYVNEYADEKEYFRRRSRHQGATRSAQARDAYPRHQEGTFQTGEIRDRYENALNDLIKAKQAGKAAPTVAEQTEQRHQIDGCVARSAKAERTAPPSKRKRPRMAEGSATPQGQEGEIAR